MAPRTADSSLYSTANSSPSGSLYSTPLGTPSLLPSLPPTLPPTLLPPTSSRLPRLPRLPRLTFEGEVGRGRRSPSPEWMEWARGDAATTTCPRCDVLNDELECEEDGCSEEPELDRTRSRTGTPIGADAVRPSKNAACELVGLLELDCSDRFKEERFGVLSGDVDPIDMRS